MKSWEGYTVQSHVAKHRNSSNNCPSHPPPGPWVANHASAPGVWLSCHSLPEVFPDPEDEVRPPVMCSRTPACLLCSTDLSSISLKCVTLSSLQKLRRGEAHTPGTLSGRATHPFLQRPTLSSTRTHSIPNTPFIFQRPARSPGTQQFACFFLLLCLHLLISLANDLKSNTLGH